MYIRYSRYIHIHNAHPREKERDGRRLVVVFCPPSAPLDRPGIPSPARNSSTRDVTSLVSVSVCAGRRRRPVGEAIYFRSAARACYLSLSLSLTLSLSFFFCIMCMCVWVGFEVSKYYRLTRCALTRKTCAVYCATSAREREALRQRVIAIISIDIRRTMPPDKKIVSYRRGCVLYAESCCVYIDARVLLLYDSRYERRGILLVGDSCDHFSIQ